MNRFRLQIRRLLSLLRAGQFGTILEKLRDRIYTNATAFCLRRDLTVPFEAPAAKIQITVQPIQEADAMRLFDPSAPGVHPDEILDRTGRMDLFREGIPTCYAAITPDGSPCYAQWLMSSADNTRVQRFFRGLFPVLAPDEALLEGAFTPESYRGLGIMARAMALIAEKARDFGARYVITFVGEDNLPSLKGCKRAGFVPHLMRKTEWRFFRGHVTFIPLPAGTPYPFDREELSKRSGAQSCVSA